ncbi:MAG: hypothetical protein RLZZ555_271 [Pseudomonadota bacterium]|jgi:hypothetical protein
MATAGSIVLDLLMRTGQFETDTARAEAIAKKRAKAIEQQFTEMSGRISTAVGGMFAGVSAAAAVGKLIAVQREFDVLNSSLVTITGSTSAAAREFSWIKDFAAETPYSLKEVTEAFVKMKALGLDASADALRSYGNTASAMGKGLNQMIEAVADAATGEFERLKEFGIKAKKQGDEVEFTFQNVKTTVGDNAAEISKYLTDIGNNQFAGAMEERAKTLDGAISNLADTWDQLFLTISQNNAGGLIYDSVKLASGAITDAITIIKAMNTATGENAREAGAMKTVQEGIATVFETVAVLGVNVAYVLKQTGNELGGLAAQAAAVARGDLAQAKAIGDMMKADAAAARAEVDRQTAAILNARRTMAGMMGPPVLTGGSGLVDNVAERQAEAYKKLMEKYATPTEKLADAIKKAKKELGTLYTPEVEKRLRENILDKPKSTGAKGNPNEFAQEGAKTWAKAMETAAKMAQDATNEVEGLSKAQADLATLMASPYWATYSDDMKSMVTASFEAADAAERNAKSTLAMRDAREKETRATLDNIASLEQQLENAQLEAVFKKDAAKAIEALAIARLREKAAILEGFDGSEQALEILNREIAAREKLLDLGISNDKNKDYWAEWLSAAEEAMTNFDELAGNVAQNFSTGFGNAFERMVFDSESLGDAVAGLAEGMARSVVNALGQMAAQWLAYQVVQMVVGKTTEATAQSALALEAQAMVAMAGLNAFAATAAIPIVGPVMAPAAAASAVAVAEPFAATVAALGAAAVAARATGGPVSDGMPYLVGERGAELFVPNTSGAIVPNSKLGGGNVTVNLIEDKSRAGKTEERTNNGAREIDVFVADLMGDGPRGRAIQKAFGLQRRGY